MNEFDILHVSFDDFEGNVFLEEILLPFFTHSSSNTLKKAIFDQCVCLFLSLCYLLVWAWFVCVYVRNDSWEKKEGGGVGSGCVRGYCLETSQGQTRKKGNGLLIRLLVLLIYLRVKMNKWTAFAFSPSGRWRDSNDKYLTNEGDDHDYDVDFKLLKWNWAEGARKDSCLICAISNTHAHSYLTCLSLWCVHAV